MNPDYVAKDLRRGVDYVGVTCVFYCHDDKGNLLMHKRSQKCRDEQGRWDVGGGAMEFGEDFEEAAAREIKEEYGVEPKNLSFVSAYNAVRDNNGIKTHWIALLFIATMDPKKVRLADQEKMDEIGWFPLDNLPEPLHSKLLTGLEIVKRAGVLS